MYLEGHDADGWTTHLKLFYRYMNKAVRATFTLKKGDAISLLSHTWNVVAHLRSSGRDFSVFDFLWNNLIFVGTDPERCLPYAPYVMFLIETTSKTIYPKDYTHSHLRIMKKRGTGLPPPPRTIRTIRSASGVPVDDTPAAAAACVAQAAATTAAVVGHDPYRPSHRSSSYVGPSTSRGKSKNKVLRAFTSLIKLCRSNAIEINKCQRGIKELQDHAATSSHALGPVVASEE
ncbi:uncharacterized protein LOC112901346 [Panicum hallii]|uniref:uncharacterized protein LOC112901346 n=1 Tax=Panicum hallii TaxID=206008 RepID=UPI000DF4D1F1|nr:uncharacterized protein LOC112901346 [Panicum hallii]